MKRTLPTIACMFAAGMAVSVAGQQVLKVDPAIGGYQKASGISGNLSSIGSDSMNNLMTLWAETFRKYYPNVKVQVEGKGSSTARSRTLRRSIRTTTSPADSADGTRFSRRPAAG